MQIAPNTIIRLLKNVPLDNSYTNTINFNDVGAQSSYFSGLSKHTLSNYTYQRKEMVLKVNVKADDCLDCNYLMYQNTSFGNKWFYAFIVNTEYISNETTAITFEIDVMQTWYFDYTLLPSFVEREHSVTDNVGDNLVPENLELGEYRYTDLGLTGLFQMPQIVVASTFDKNFNPAVGGMYGGVYSGLCYNVFSSYTTCNDFLIQATDKNLSDGIVSIFMLPIAFCSDFQETMPLAFNVARDKKVDSIGGYIPKNKKLLTYPYNLLYVTNNEGMCANYRYEFFTSSQCNFDVSGVMCCTPEVMMTPKNYKGVPLNYNEKLTIGSFPQCAYSIDSYRAFIAQNSMSLPMDIAMGAIQTAAGVGAMSLSGGVIGGGQVVGGLSNISSKLTQVYEASTQPPQAKGNTSSFINMANEIKGFQFYHVQISREFALIIDDYFNMFGYATNRVKKPNTNSRPHWNYVKTINCNLKGSVPANDIAKIKSVYDRGVTFWKNGLNLGNYNLINNV